MTDRFVAVDIETTGLNYSTDKIIEIGMQKYENGVCVDTYETLINPKKHISNVIRELTGIDDDMLKEAPAIEDIIGKVVDFIGDYPVLGHNIPFDYKFIKKAAEDLGINFTVKGIDTYKIAKKLIEVPSYKLEYLCEFFNIHTVHHRALADAESAAKIFFILKDMDESAIQLYDIPYKTVKHEPATTRQLVYLQALMDRKNITFERNIKDLTKSEASRIIDNIISGNF